MFHLLKYVLPNKKTKLLLIFSFFAGQLLSAQKTDSLVQVLKTAKEDTNKVNTINILVSIYINNGSYDVALQYASQAKALARQLSFTRGEAIAFKKIGRIYFSKGNYAQAVTN